MGVRQAANLARSVFEVVANIRDRQPSLVDACILTDDLLSNPELPVSVGRKT